jgi:uncharacterized protein
LEATIDTSADVSPRCMQCNANLLPDEKFCGYCGLEVAVQEEGVKGEDVFTVIGPALAYYFVTLVVLATYKLTPLFKDGIEGLVVISVIDVIIVLAFWGYFFRALKPLFVLRNLDLKLIFFTIAGAITAAVAVSFLADFINISLYDDVYYSPYLFHDTSQPVLWAVILTCLQPAIFEEVAFRGFIFTNVQVLASATGAVFISAVLFGIIHLSFISLLWLVPLGIVFAWFRMRFNTLWYGIIGHFFYNFTVLVIEFYF